MRRIILKCDFCFSLVVCFDCRNFIFEAKKFVHIFKEKNLMRNAVEVEGPQKKLYKNIFY